MRREEWMGRLAITMTVVGAFLLASLALVGSPSVAQSGSALPGLDGGSLNPSELGQGSHVLVVWASWSPRCRDIVPRVNEVASRMGGRARVAAINFQEEPAAAEAFLAGKGLAVPVYLDRSGDFSKAHAVTTLPGLIVYRDGEVRFQGRLENDAAAQVEALFR